MGGKGYESTPRVDREDQPNPRRATNAPPAAVGSGRDDDAPLSVQRNLDRATTLRSFGRLHGIQVLNPEEDDENQRPPAPNAGSAGAQVPLSREALLRIVEEALEILSETSDEGDV